jgi:hypothetical protein
MPITIKSLTQLLASVFYLTSSTALNTPSSPKVAGEQIVFTSSSQLVVREYEQMPCPVKVENYLNIFDESSDRCVYVAPETLIKVFNSLNSPN